MDLVETKALMLGVESSKDTAKQWDSTLRSKRSHFELLAITNVKLAYGNLINSFMFWIIWIMFLDNLKKGKKKNHCMVSVNAKLE